VEIQFNNIYDGKKKVYNTFTLNKMVWYMEWEKERWCHTVREVRLWVCNKTLGVSSP